MQPLVLRPAYGERRSAPVAEAKLPGGGPAEKGLSLDPTIPGTQTFTKPEGDPSRESPNEDESIWKVDDADDLTKDQDKTPQDINETNKNRRWVQHAPGKDVTPKTKYPYRDDKRNVHNAAAFVYGSYVVARAHELVLPTQDGAFKIATRLEAIETGLNPAVKTKGAQCSVKLKRSDVANLRWLFSVDCGNGAKVVRLKAERSAKVTAMPKMDLHMSCSCPAWRWLGPEHHSKREQYIDGEPRGTASVPVIRDPEGKNRVCKHVAAVLSAIRQWQVPTAKNRQMKPK